MNYGRSQGCHIMLDRVVNEVHFENEFDFCSNHCRNTSTRLSTNKPYSNKLSKNLMEYGQERLLVFFVKCNQD
jgi:hypothetical protein